MIFESFSKSILPNWRLRAQCRVDSKSRVSPKSTSSNGINYSVLTNTKRPSSPQMNIARPTLFYVREKEASTLHLYQLTLGLCHFTSTFSSSYHHKVYVLPRIVCANSIVLFQTLLFLCFHMLSNVTSKTCFCWTIGYTINIIYTIFLSFQVWSSLLYLMYEHFRPPLVLCLYLLESRLG